jgi:hypothetical protein
MSANFNSAFNILAEGKLASFSKLIQGRAAKE